MEEHHQHMARARPRGGAIAAGWLRRLFCPLPCARVRDARTSLLPGVVALLSDRTATPEPGWDPTHHGLHRVVRGIPRDLAPFRALEVFLRRFLDNKGRVDRPDGLRRHTPPFEVGDRLPGGYHHEVQQGLALVTILC